MLIVEIILFLLFVICLIIAKEIYQMSVTFKMAENSQSREIKNKKLWNRPMTMTITSTVILGLLASILLVDGLRGRMVFKQVSGIFVVVLAIPVLQLGYMFIREFVLDWEKAFWKRIAIIILLILPISAGTIEILYQSKTETNTHIKIEVLETVQLDPLSEIITCMSIKGKGDVFYFCPQVGEEDTVLAKEAKTTFTNSAPYMEKRRLTTVITATYPNGKSEEREVFTETDYMFYAPEDLFYGLNRN